MSTTKAKPSESELVARFNSILIEQLGIDENAITPDANIETDLGADELDLVELTMMAEEEFGIVLDEDKVDKIKTVDHFRTLLKSTIGI